MECAFIYAHRKQCHQNKSQGLHSAILGYCTLTWKACWFWRKNLVPDWIMSWLQNNYPPRNGKNTRHKLHLKISLWSQIKSGSLSQNTFHLSAKISWKLWPYWQSKVSPSFLRSTFGDYVNIYREIHITHFNSCILFHFIDVP